MQRNSSLLTPYVSHNLRYIITYVLRLTLAVVDFAENDFLCFANLFVTIHRHVPSVLWEFDTPTRAMRHLPTLRGSARLFYGSIFVVRSPDDMVSPFPFEMFCFNRYILHSGSFSYLSALFQSSFFPSTHQRRIRVKDASSIVSVMNAFIECTCTPAFLCYLPLSGEEMKGSIWW